MDAKTLKQAALEAADQIQGLSMAAVFNDGPRRLFLEHQVPRHGTYRLYIARPFGVRRPGGQRWRIQLTVQFEGQEQQHSVNDGHITVPFEALGSVIADAAEQMEAHIKANSKTVQQLRRAAMQAVQPDAVTIGDAGDVAPACVTHGDALEAEGQK